MGGGGGGGGGDLLDMTIKFVSITQTQNFTPVLSRLRSRSEAFVLLFGVVGGGGVNFFVFRSFSRKL